MESPVRIALGAAVVAYLLLLSSTTVSGNALPLETTPTTTVRDEKPTRYTKINSTSWVQRGRPKSLDIALNELQPKGLVSEEHTEKNAKYKHRGRVRYGAHSSSESPIRRVRSSTAESIVGKLVIVTPTPEVKKPAQIIDSMRTYKKRKLPTSTSTTSANVPIKSHEEEEDDDNSFELFSNKYHDSNFYTIPSYNEGADHKKDPKKEGPQNAKNDYTSTDFSSFSSFVPMSYSSKEDYYKSDSFFDFNSGLTTPRNEFFDKKYQDISKSIERNLNAAQIRSSNNTANAHKIAKHNVGNEKIIDGRPGNKTTMIIKNTKKIKLLDNEKAGSNKEELSDVQGTSIYYEMSSILSTETTYAINNSNDDDCDNDTSPSETTTRTPVVEQSGSLRATPSNLFPVSTKPLYPDPEFVSTISSNFLQSSSLPSFFNSPSHFTFSTQNSVTSTEKTTRPFSSTLTNRNRGYSKRLNITNSKDSPNSVTVFTDNISPGQSYRNSTRKFHSTTPKSKPTWMAPRRNTTRTYAKPTYPTTIYAEHFSIKDRTSTTPRSKPSNKTVLTTVSSDIDPVQQSDVSGIKKVVHSQTISDNSIPSLWKRGSTKYLTTTANSTEVETSSSNSELEYPPSLTAWALAGLRSPPSMASTAANATGSTSKSVDENELQEVNEIAEKNEVTTSSTTIKPGLDNNNLVTKKVEDINQNQHPWRPVVAQTSTESEIKVTENKSESLPAESNISVQSTVQPGTTTETTEEAKNVVVDNTKVKQSDTSWVPINGDQKTLDKEGTTEKLAIPPVDATKSTGFESITKLPKEITTPQDETAISSNRNNEIATEVDVIVPTTTDYEITTIRFDYVPTEHVTDKTEISKSTNGWHPVAPTRTKGTTIEDSPITTYRPKYETTTDSEDEMPTNIPDTTPQVEISSQVINTTKILADESDLTTETISDTTSYEASSEATATETENNVETTTIIMETTSTEFKEATDNNGALETDKDRLSTQTIPSSIETTETAPSEVRDNESTSEENSHSNEVITLETSKPIALSSSSTTTSSTTTTTTTEPIKESSTTTTTETITEIPESTTEIVETTTLPDAKIIETSPSDEVTIESTTDLGTKSVNELEDVSSYGDVTTGRSMIAMEEAGSGAAVAIAVSTIGVIALILLIGLLLVVRRRGRRGVYAQRCTPVSLDAYSLDSVSVGHRKGNQRLRASKRSYGNPAYDDEVTSHPMNYAALANFALDIESMSTEFAEIPSVTVRPDEVPPGCEDKNRYSNVLPLPETRVPLKRIGNDPTSEYINANFITGPGNIRNYYIACQAPLPNTVTDFWRMIWEQNSRVIVMLTEYMENGVEKCYEYLPPSEVSDNKRNFGEFQIILKKREQRDKYAISSVQLINLSTRTWREVTHLWYFWPAKGVPDDYDSVIDFLSEMRSYMKISQTAKEYDEDGVEVIYGDQNRSSFNNLSKLREESNAGNGVNVYSPSKAEEMMRRGHANNGTLSRMKAASEIEGVRPCTVVCASGAGRSCALVALDVCARALAAHAADVPRVVRELRAQRPHSLSNRQHYIFLYKVLSEYGNKLMGGGVDTI